MKNLKILFLIITLALCFIVTGEVNAATTTVSTALNLKNAMEATTTEDETIKLSTNITLDEDFVMVINGGSKTFDLNGYKLTVNGQIQPSYYTNDTLYITDSGTNGTIESTSAFFPINYQTTSDPNPVAKLTINGGIFIVNYGDIFRANCHNFILTINDGTFKSYETMINSTGGYDPQISLKKFTFENTDKDDRNVIQIGINSVNHVSDWLASGSNLYYVGPTGKAVYRSDEVQGKKYNALGSLLVTNEAITTYHLVSFHDYVGYNDSEQYIAEGNKVTIPEIDIPNGKTFMGWYTDEGFNNKYDFNTLVYQDIDLYAKWEYTATGSIGGTEADFGTQTVGYSGVNSWSVPIFIDTETTVDPARLEATLIGATPDAFDVQLKNDIGVMEGPGMWNTWGDFHVGPKTGLEIGTYTATLTLKYDQDNDGIYEVTIGTKNLLFKVVDKFTVSFNTNGGSYVAPQYVRLEDGVTRPPSPTKDGYIFDDWYTNPECTTPFLFGTTINSDMTLYAKWLEEPKVYKVTFVTYGGSEVPEQDVTEGNTIVKPNNPTKAGYVFGGWYQNESLTSLYDLSSPVNKDIQLHAKWLYDLKSNKAKIENIKDKVYNGKVQTPNIKLTYNGTLLKKNIDYKLEYKNNKNTGKATITIKGIGNYSGTITKTFRIIPSKAVISKVTKTKKSITIKWNKISTSTGYQVAFRKMGPNKYKYYTVTATSKKFTKLKSKKYHQMKVRAYKVIDGKKYYGAWSIVKKVRTK